LVNVAQFFLAVAALIAALTGCATKARSVPSNVPNASVLIEIEGLDTITAWYFRNDTCQPEDSGGLIGTAGPLLGRELKISVPTGERLYFALNRISPRGTNLNGQYVTLHCDNWLSFIAEDGASYQINQLFSEEGCIGLVRKVDVNGRLMPEPTQESPRLTCRP
jgi:hypothetical protein